MTPEEGRIAAAALLALRGMGPATLRRLLTAWPDPLDVVAALRSGRATAVLADRPGDADARVRRWRAELDLERARHVLTARGTRVVLATDADSPVDPDLPDHAPVLLVEGAPAGRARAPTRRGRRDARGHPARSRGCARSSARRSRTPG